MNIFKRVIINTGVQIIGRFFSFFLSFVSIYLLTRYLGVSGYGTYSLVFSYLSFFNILSDMGLSLIVVRELSKKTEVFSDDLNNFISIKLFLTILSIGLAIGILMFMPYSQEAKLSIIIASIGVGVGGIASFGSSILQSRLRMDLVTIIDQVTKLITVAFIYVFILTNQNLYTIVSTILIGNLFGLGLMVLFVKKVIVIKNFFTFKINKKIVKQGLLMGVLTLIAYSYFKVDTIILSLYRTSEELGIYSLAYKVIENITMFWGLYMASIYPIFSMYVDKDKNKYQRLLKKTMGIGLVFSLVCLIIGYSQVEFIIKLFGGNNFFNSIIPLRILLFGIPLFIVNNIFYNAFLSKVKIIQVITCFSLSLIFNIIINFIYIPKYGYIAASYTTVLTELVLFLLYLGFYKISYEKK